MCVSMEPQMLPGSPHSPQALFRFWNRRAVLWPKEPIVFSCLLSVSGWAFGEGREKTGRLITALEAMSCLLQKFDLKLRHFMCWLTGGPCGVLAWNCFQVAGLCKPPLLCHSGFRGSRAKEADEINLRILWEPFLVLPNSKSTQGEM